MSSKNSSKDLPGNRPKLPRLPDGTKVQKRPLNRRQPPASSKARIIYVSSRTPFMAAVTRVRKQLDREFKGRSTGAKAAPKHASIDSRVEALQWDMAAKNSSSGNDGGGSSSMVVTLMGTGKAIERTLSLASWFEQQGDCHVAIKTRTVGTIDDVVIEDEDEEDESRVRLLSCLEVSIKLK